MFEQNSFHTYSILLIRPTSGVGVGVGVDIDATGLLVALLFRGVDGDGLAFEVVRTGDEDDDDDDCEEEEERRRRRRRRRNVSQSVPAVGGTKVLALVDVDGVLLLLFLLLLVVVVVAMVVGALPLSSLEIWIQIFPSLTNAYGCVFSKPLRAFHAFIFSSFRWWVEMLCCNLLR